MNDQPLSPADEDALVLPDSWRRQLHHRRGGARPAAPAKTDARAGAKVRKLIETSRESLDGMRSADPDLVEAARRHLAGEPDPLGAALVAVAVTRVTLKATGTTAAELNMFADAWAAEHGLPFAASALLEAVAVVVVQDQGLRAERKANANAEAGGALRRMRLLLAAAGDAEHTEAVALMADRRADKVRKWASAYLVPSRHDWVAEACTLSVDHGERPMARGLLLTSLGTAEHLAALGGRAALGWSECTLAVLGSILDGCGADALPTLVTTVDKSYLDAAERRRVFEAISLVPTDEALQALIDRRDDKHARPALLAAVRRFPHRAVRLLGPAADDPAALRILTAVVRANPGVPLDGLPDKVRAALDTGPAVPDAAPEDLPVPLVSPPWTRARKTARPVVVTGLTPPAELRMAWAHGEREAWGSSDIAPEGLRFGPDPDWQEHAEAFAPAGKTRPDWSVTRKQIALFAQGPVELFRPLLREWDVLRYWDRDDIGWMKVVASRYERDARHLALRAAAGNPAGCGTLLLPFLDVEAAVLMADVLTRSRTARRSAIAWFERHGTAAAPFLVPDALGKAGKTRAAAEAALRLIAARTGGDAVVAATRERYDDRVADAIASVLAADPLEILPKKLPEPGEWAAPALFPQVLLRGRETALPLDAVQHLIMMLALSKPGEPYGGVETVRELCDPASLAAFGWALFREWEANGAPSAESWAFTQLALLGDDETVRGLTPMIRAWPGDGGHAKAVTGLDVLAEIGTDVALMHLHGIAQKVKFKGLKARAQEKIEQVAANLELTADQLADRLVPDFGLDADGGMVLDYGPRRFHVGFDEQLKPFVTDEAGKLRKALPKPGAKDDEELATASYKRFAALKKDVRTAAALQIERLETAMVEGRRWTPEEFRAHLVGHPLMWHVARRLVWLAWEGERAVPFRVAEDRTFADADDDAFTLPDDARVGVAHPLHLGGAAKAWAEVFADYEILQPFPQLGRPVHALTETERAGKRLDYFEGVTVPVGDVLALLRRGWRRTEPQDAGGEPFVFKPLPGGLHLVADLYPGLIVGYVAEHEEQRIERVRLTDDPGRYWRTDDPPHTFADLDPVAASELLADLATLKERA
ncbi:DUF4132 domain-containing protein [Spirillospora sp. CA-253888]